VLSEREVSPQLGLLKSTLLQLDSTFSERTYGAGSFRDFAQKLERAGVLRVHQGRGGWIGETAGVDDGAGATPAADLGPRPERSAEPATIGTAADGVREFRRILAAGEIRRWPMYLRNVKQVIRQVAPAFDERAYGAAQKEGFVRVDRDRQGVVRVFQGATPLTGESDVTAGVPPADEMLIVGEVVEPVVVAAIETTVAEMTPMADAFEPGPDGEGEPPDDQISVIGRDRLADSHSATAHIDAPRKRRARAPARPTARRPKPRRVT
jgi:hypothetical protein